MVTNEAHASLLFRPAAPHSPAILSQFSLWQDLAARSDNSRHSAARVQYSSAALRLLVSVIMLDLAQVPNAICLGSYL